MEARHPSIHLVDLLQILLPVELIKIAIVFSMVNYGYKAQRIVVTWSQNQAARIHSKLAKSWSIGRPVVGKLVLISFRATKNVFCFYLPANYSKTFNIIMNLVIKPFADIHAYLFVFILVGSGTVFEDAVGRCQCWCRIRYRP